MRQVTLCHRVEVHRTALVVLAQSTADVVTAEEFLARVREPAVDRER
ncbi:hypothetical protein ACIBSV_00220 [Embleya sp. NPDC050154]